MGFKRDVLELVLTAAEVDLLTELCQILKSCTEVSVFLQNLCTRKVGVDVVRATFDELIKEHPSMEKHLSKDARIVHDKHFENAVVKVLRHDEKSLTAAEKSAISIFLLDPLTAAAAGDRGDRGSILARALVENSRKVARKSLYRPMTHVCSTSNIVERLFSRAKLVSSPQRRSMDPSTLEGLLILRVNNDLWDEYLIQDVINSESKEVAAEKALGVDPDENQGEQSDAEEQKESDAVDEDIENENEISDGEDA